MHGVSQVLEDIVRAQHADGAVIDNPTVIEITADPAPSLRHRSIQNEVIGNGIDRATEIDSLEAGVPREFLGECPDVPVVDGSFRQLANTSVLALRVVFAGCVR